MTPPPEGCSGVYAGLAVRPDCPVASVASEVPLREFVPATGSGPPRLVAERPVDATAGSDSFGDPAEDDDRLQPVVRTDESIVCRVSGDAECSHDRSGLRPRAVPAGPARGRLGGRRDRHLGERHPRERVENQHPGFLRTAVGPSRRRQRDGVGHDDGSTHDKLGIADANKDFSGVDSDGDADVTVVGGGREAFRRSGGKWSPGTTPTGQNLKAVVDGKPALAVGAGGTVLARN